MLAIGFIANLMISPVAKKFFMTDKELLAEKRLAHEKLTSAKEVIGRAEKTPLITFLAWSAVGIPISYGIWSTIQKAWILFH